LISKIKKLARSLTGNAMVVGVVSLFWLLFRSGTKPSRIVYPCQRAAAATSYTFLLYPMVTFLAGLSKKIVPKVFCAVRHLNRRNPVILISLLSVSALFSGLAAYANLIINPMGTLQERITLVERLTSVAVIRVENGQVEQALETAVNHLGGIEDVVPEGSKVLIKPNIVQSQAPPDTTDPTVVEALTNVLRRRNPSVIWIADGSGHGDTTENLRSLGYFPVAEGAGAELVDLNYGEMMNVSVPGGGIVFDNFTFNRVVVEADVFVSVACLKTHSQAVVTLGMKNLIGLAPGSIYGFPKDVLHQRAQGKGDLYMAGVIVDLCRARKIDLVVIDGRVGMEGEGPHSGTPVKLDLIIVGRDPVATDSVASIVMGFDPEKVPTLRLGQEKGLGTNDLHRIEVRGEKLENVFHPFICASGHDSFQMFSRSQILFHQSRVLLIYPAAILWTSTILFVVLWIKKLWLFSSR